MPEIHERVREEAGAISWTFSVGGDLEDFYLRDEPPVHDAVARALLSAERRGAEEMREKAAHDIDTSAGVNSLLFADLVRSLPLPGDPESGDGDQHGV